MSRDMAPMRLALVLPSYAGGGAERVMLTLAAHLDRAKFTPSLIVLDPRGPLASLVPRDIEVVALDRPRLRQALPALVRAIRRHEPRAVLTTIGYMNLGVLLVKPFLGRVAIVVRESNPPRSPLPTAILRAVYGLLYRRARLVIAPTEQLARQLVEQFRVPAARVTVLFNPVDVAALRRGAATPKRFAGAGPRFVAVGRLVAQKGFDRLLRLVAAASPDVHATILGDGPGRASLEALALALGVAEKVRFAGFEPSPAPWLAGPTRCCCRRSGKGYPTSRSRRWLAARRSSPRARPAASMRSRAWRRAPRSSSPLRIEISLPPWPAPPLTRSAPFASRFFRPHFTSIASSPNTSGRLDD